MGFVMKDHEIALFVNRLRDIATKYHAHQCLRELISQEVLRSLPSRHMTLDQIDLEPLKAELSDPAKAKAFLQRGGFLNASGELSEQYGGKPLKKKEPT